MATKIRAKEKPEKKMFPMLTMSQTVKLTGVKQATLKNWCDQRKIPHYRMGPKTVLFSEPELLEFFSEKFKRFEQVG